MNPTDFIPQFAKLHHPEARTLYRAYIQCLEPAEVCRLFETTFTQDKSTRLIFLNKIVADMQRHVDGCHIALIDTLLMKFGTVPYRIRQGVGSCLGKLYEQSPEALKRRILVLQL